MVSRIEKYLNNMTEKTKARTSLALTSCIFAFAFGCIGLTIGFNNPSTMSGYSLLLAGEMLLLVMIILYAGCQLVIELRRI